jgi:ribulose-bisphosphate carboxylase large chain
MPSYQQAAQQLSGIRFKVTYSFFGTEEEARKSAEATCVEETIEFPPDLLPSNDYWNEVKGRLEDFQPVAEAHYRAEISYAVETTSPDILQVLNVIYGNTAMIPNVRVEDAEFPPEMLAWFRGPRFGLPGVREICGVHARPMICATIKPMGLSLDSLAEIAYEVALGGSDLVKDDHGITNQPFANFEERVSKCAAAVSRANAESGENCLYVPNVTAPVDEVLIRAYFAKDAGAQALMLTPGLTGWDTLRLLSMVEDLALPVICHPSHYGIYYLSEKAGFSARFAYGILPRLAGADISILPNYIGRLHAEPQDCLDAISAAKQPMGQIKTLFPAPGGGITLDTIPDLLAFYDNDVIFIMGGGLHKGHAPLENCRKFRKMVESNTA